MSTTYAVRIYSILTNNLANKKKSYTVRWKVGEQNFRETFTAKAAAESFRSKLLLAHREGIAFDTESGLPVTMRPKAESRPWFEHAQAYVDLKWSRSSAKHRQSIADGLASVTLALCTTEMGKPPYNELRDVMYGWAFNKVRRDSEPVPHHLRSALAWLEANTITVDQLEDSTLVRGALDSLTVRPDGKKTAASSVSRKRAVFSGALKYAVERGDLSAHPFQRLTWAAPRTNDEFDERTVPNPDQAERLLGWVGEDSPDFEAFFGSMYECALRPQEALHLHKDEYERPKESGGWGWLLLSGATVATAATWSDSDTAIDNRPLKWRGEGATRRVPVPPQQVERFDRHLERFGTSPDGRLFVTRRYGKGKYRAIGTQPFARATYCRVWARARAAVLTPEQVASPLAAVPYHLRAACISRWLEEGIPVQRAAKWAGHSVSVLTRVYAKCIDQQEDELLRRLDAARNSHADTDP